MFVPLCLQRSFFKKGVLCTLQLRFGCILLNSDLSHRLNLLPQSISPGLIQTQPQLGSERPQLFTVAP